MTTPLQTKTQTTTAPDITANGPDPDITPATSFSQSPDVGKAGRGRRGDVTPPRPGKPGELRRIFALFSEHRLRLLFVAVLIVASALISVASPFLLRAILDVSLPARDTALTALL